MYTADMIYNGLTKIYRTTYVNIVSGSSTFSSNQMAYGTCSSIRAIIVLTVINVSTAVISTVARWTTTLVFVYLILNA